MNRLPRISVLRLLQGRALPWVVATVATAAAVGFGILWSIERAPKAQEEEVAGTARRFLQALTNFSGDTIERDVTEIRSYAVGDFADQVEETFSPDRIAAIERSEAESVGEVRDLVVTTLEDDTAEVFAVVDETVTNRIQTAPRTDVLRVELGLIETPDAWKVNRVDILQSPDGVPVG